MTDKYRSREEIVGTITRLSGTFTVGDQLCLEVLLDIRDQQKEIIDLLRNPPVEFTVADVPGAPTQFRMQEAWKPEPDLTLDKGIATEAIKSIPSLDEAVEVVRRQEKGTIVNPHFLARELQITFGRASALTDALEQAGVVTGKDERGMRRVV